MGTNENSYGNALLQKSVTPSYKSWSRPLTRSLERTPPEKNWICAPDATICTYLSSIRLRLLELGFRPTPEMPLLRLLLRGIKREKGARSKPKRQPITLPLLKALKNTLRTSHFTLYDQKMLWAAFTTAFFGFLRASEFCSPSQSAFDCTTTLLVLDITVLPNVAISRIKTSKGDQFRKGSEVRLATSGKSVCPFRSLEQHLLQCTNPDLPLFTFSYGTYLTRQILSDLVKSLLPQSCDKSVYLDDLYTLKCIL